MTRRCVKSDSHCMQYTKCSPLGCFNLVPLYKVVVAEEELMKVAESPWEREKKLERCGQKPLRARWREGVVDS